MTNPPTVVALRVNNRALRDTLARILDRAGYFVIGPEDRETPSLVLTTDADTGLNACASLVAMGAPAVVFMSRNSPAIRTAYVAAGAVPIEIGVPASEILDAVQAALADKARGARRQANGPRVAV